MEVKFTKKDILERGVEEVIKKDSLQKKLSSTKKLRVKFGIDPTGPDIHLGHTVPLLKLRQFQELGHKAVLIIGDFTAIIGDPSGRKEDRKVLAKTEVKKNMQYYLKQAEKILDMKKVEVRHNSEWFGKEGIDEMIRLARTTTYQQLARREDFKGRIEAGWDINFSEFIYPLLQGYDSVKVKADVEIGGIDQKFNLLMGRQVQKRYGLQEQDIVMTPLLLGTDGVKKMSKSYGNYIAVQDKPDDMFGKVMNIQDKEILHYYELATPLPTSKLEKLKKESGPRQVTGPQARELKFNLAKLITKVYWGQKEAERAAEEFETVFKKQETPKDLKQVKIAEKNINIIELLVNAGLAPSKSEARRLVAQGAIRVDGKKVENAKESVQIKNSFVLAAGRRKMVKITPKK